MLPIEASSDEHSLPVDPAHLDGCSNAVVAVGQVGALQKVHDHLLVQHTELKVPMPLSPPHCTGAGAPQELLHAR